MRNFILFIFFYTQEIICFLYINNKIAIKVYWDIEEKISHRKKSHTIRIFLLDAINNKYLISLQISTYLCYTSFRDRKVRNAVRLILFSLNVKIN